MIALFGSGFGIYGYLPALIGGCGQTVILPERYRTKFMARPELASFAADVEWAADDRLALARASGAAYAVRPVDQQRLIPDCLALPAIERILVEKPLAPTPEAAIQLLETLVRSRRAFRIGYTFAQTNWGKRLAAMLPKGGVKRLSIEWCFLADHFARDIRTWKRFHHEGGGAIRFYGIQLIALLAELGYREAMTSETWGAHLDQPATWQARLTGRQLPECTVILKTRARAMFRVEVETEMGQAVSVAAQGGPFDDAARRADGLDARVDVLTNICRDLLAGDGSSCDWYEAALELWRKIEAINEFRLAALP